MRIIFYKVAACACLFFFTHTVNASGTDGALTLEKAIAIAMNNDPWLQGSHLQQKALEAQSVASSTMADPRISVGVANLPIDSFDFNQEVMTQFKVGVSQALPRGDSLAIKQEKLSIEASRQPLLRADRKLKLTVKVSELWYDAYLAQQTIDLITQDKALFEQLADVAKASYSSGLGKTRQQDVISAQLELVQLDDKFIEQQQALESALASLNEYLQIIDASTMTSTFDYQNQPRVLKLSDSLPDLSFKAAKLFSNQFYGANEMVEVLAQHPSLKAIDNQYKATHKNVELAEQGYKPQWGVTASYGHRDDASTGIERSDFFSVGVSFDLPLFTQDKQDQQVAASIANAEVVKTNKLLVMKKMMANVDREMRNLKRLSDRQVIYKDMLLKQSREHAEAALTAYTNDDGNFAEVVQARVSELNIRIAALKIDINAGKTLARLNYFFDWQTTDPHNNAAQNTARQNTENQSIFERGLN